MGQPVGQKPELGIDLLFDKQVEQVDPKMTRPSQGLTQTRLKWVGLASPSQIVSPI